MGLYFKDLSIHRPYLVAACAQQPERTQPYRAGCSPFRDTHSRTFHHRTKRVFKAISASISAAPNRLKFPPSSLLSFGHENGRRPAPRVVNRPVNHKVHWLPCLLRQMLHETFIRLEIRAIAPSARSACIQEYRIPQEAAPVPASSPGSLARPLAFLPRSAEQIRLRLELATLPVAGWSHI